MHLDEYSMLALLRDLVDEYDKTISRAKVLAGRVSRLNTKSLHIFLNNIAVLLDKTNKALQGYEAVINNNNMDDTSRKYLQTYYSYLHLVSIPYTRDLLVDIRDKLIRDNRIEDASKVEKIIVETENLLNTKKYQV